MASQVHADHPELVADTSGQWVEKSGAEAVGVEDHQGVGVEPTGPPVQEGDPESVPDDVAAGRSARVAGPAHPLRSTTIGVWPSTPVGDDTEP